MQSPNRAWTWGPVAPLVGRDIGQDFDDKNVQRMYQGTVVAVFPQHPYGGFETVTFSGFSGAEAREQAHRAELDAFLVKPFHEAVQRHGAFAEDGGLR